MNSQERVRSATEFRRPDRVPVVFWNRFNLGRSRRRDGKVERTAYSPTGKGDFHVPEKFAKLWGR
jgi:hypothetical protein